MAHVLIVHESQTTRDELAQALQAEGFTVAQADTSTSAIREIWAGSFDAALVGPQLPRVSGTPLADHLKSIAPEIVTVVITKEAPARLARRVADIFEGLAA